MRKKQKKMWSLVSSLNFQAFLPFLSQWHELHRLVHLFITIGQGLCSAENHESCFWTQQRKEGRTIDKKSVGPMSSTNLHCKITHLIVTQYTCSHHVVSKPRFSKYNYNSISNRNGHQPASHDTRLHANRGLATITKKRYKWRSTFGIFEQFSNDCRKTKTKAITPTLSLIHIWRCRRS